MVSAEIIRAANAAAARSEQSTSPSSQQDHLSRRQFPSRTSQQNSSWSPLPRYFFTASAVDSNQNAARSTTTDAPRDATLKPATDCLPSDTVTNRFKNFARLALGQMSPEGKKAYWEEVDERYSALDCRRCESNRDYLLQYSPVIRYMNENIRRLGGDLNSTNIRCRTCKPSEAMLGGFDHQYGIKICANLVETRSMFEDVLAHEMVHAYDHLRFKTTLGPDEDLRKVACSEIRASNLSGECRWANEFFGNRVMSFTGHHQDCVRRRAVESVKRMPKCGGDKEKATKVVDEVWDSCFRDTRPFDEIYR